MFLTCRIMTNIMKTWRTLCQVLKFSCTLQEIARLVLLFEFRVFLLDHFRAIFFTNRTTMMTTLSWSFQHNKHLKHGRRTLKQKRLQISKECTPPSNSWIHCFKTKCLCVLVCVSTDQWIKILGLTWKKRKIEMDRFIRLFKIVCKRILINLRWNFVSFSLTFSLFCFEFMFFKTPEKKHSTPNRRPPRTWASHPMLRCYSITTSKSFIFFIDWVPKCYGHLEVPNQSKIIYRIKSLARTNHYSTWFPLHITPYHSHSTTRFRFLHF